MSTPAERELAYYEDLYSGFAQQHFAKPAVAAFRRYLAAESAAGRRFEDIGDLGGLDLHDLVAAANGTT